VTQHPNSQLDADRRALVLGGAGFIGSSLVDRLLADGWVVAVLDAFEPFYPRERKEANLAGASSNPRFMLYEADTRDLDPYRAIVGEVRPDVIVDLAARAGVRDSLTNPWLYIDVNVRGLQNSLQLAAEQGARYVFTSSSSVYGNDVREPFTEEQMRCRPESPYGATKIAGEALVSAHHAASGLQVGMARLFTVFGPRQRPDLAIHKFALRMLRGEPIELYDQGRPRRDYTYVGDIVDGFVRLIETDRPYTLVNFGSHRPYTVAEMVDALEQVFEIDATRILQPPAPGDVKATYASIERARRQLDWAPQVSLLEGMRRFRDWLIEAEDLDLT
jgi:UDP-glucuronate 4-epimerase